MLYCKYLFRSVFLLLEHKLIEGREHVLVAYLFLIEINYFRIVLDLHKSYKNSRESLHIPLVQFSLLLTYCLSFIHFFPTKESTLVY